MKTKKDKKTTVESEIEKEYKKLFNEIRPKIQEKLDLAVQAMNEAQALADAHGIPFNSPLSFFHDDSYIPESFGTIREKFTENNAEEKLSKIIGEMELYHVNWWEDEDDGYDGWESDGWSYSSMFC